MKRDVYLRSPPGLRKKGVVWKVLRPIYGLKDYAKNWFNTMKSEPQISIYKYPNITQNFNDWLFQQII